MSKELKDWILDYFDWWSSGHEGFIKSAERMIAFGMTEDTIKEILQDCYSAVANEFQ